MQVEPGRGAKCSALVTGVLANGWGLDGVAIRLCDLDGLILCVESIAMEIEKCCVVQSSVGTVVSLMVT